VGVFKKKTRVKVFLIETFCGNTAASTVVSCMYVTCGEQSAVLSGMLCCIQSISQCNRWVEFTIASTHIVS